jgi:hypothetical protein
MKITVTDSQDRLDVSVSPGSAAHDPRAIRHVHADSGPPPRQIKEVGDALAVDGRVCLLDGQS